MRSLRSKTSAASAVQPLATDRRRYKTRKLTGIGRNDHLKKGGDYTDIAYKEAVSKLKSMLTDGYTSHSKYPHHFVDDSEDDSGMSFLVSDTTRVSRLGAYSRPYFKSYLPPKMSPAALNPAPEVHPTGSTSNAQPELLSFIERQEDYIEQLEKESQYCRDELSQLLGKVKDLISENESLHAQQKPVSYKCDHNVSEHRARSRSPTLTSENKYRSNLDGPSIVFESRISELEAQLTQVRLDLKKAQEEAIIYKRKSIENDPTSSSSEFYRQIESLHREKRELSDSLNKLQSAVSQLRERESDSSRKVMRTQDMAEKAQMDKQQAEMEVQRLKSELDHQHQRLLDVLSEQTRKVAEERSQAERRYLQHVEQLSAELTVQRDTAAKLQLELDRHSRVEEDLRRDLAAKNQTADNLRKELNAKISSLQSEVAAALSDRDSLEQELSTNKMSGERSERSVRQESSRLQMEISALRQRIERNDAELIQSRRENLRLSEQISTQDNEIALYKTKLGEIDDDGRLKTANSVRDLEGVVEKQSQAMNLLTGQCHSLMQKLEDTNVRHKEEMAGLQTSLEFLTSRLDTTVLARQWPTDNFQHSGETYPDPRSQHADQAYTPNAHEYSHEQQPVAAHEAVEKVATPVVDRPILSRTNSRGERSESPKVKKERRTLTRRESRMQIQKVDYPLPKHPNIEPPQQPQRGISSTEQSYRNDSVQDPAIYRSEIPEQPQEYHPTEAIAQDSYPENYSTQGPEIQGYQGQEFQQQDQYPQDYNYPDQQPYYENSQQDQPYYPEVEQYGTEPQFTRQEDRAPSRESLRRQYQDEMAQGYPTEGYRGEERTPSRESQRKSYQETPPNYTPEMVRQRKSSSGESTGAPQPVYGQQSEVFQPSPSEQQPLRQPSFPPEAVAKSPQQPPYQQSEILPQSTVEQQPRQPSFGPDEVRTPAKPPQQREQPKQIRTAGESIPASEQKQPDAPRTKSSPPSATARREAGTKLNQKMQRSVPTKFQ